MPQGAEYRFFLQELFEPVFPVTIKRMFGGAGIYRGAIMFALADGDRIYLKADDESRAAFEAAGSAPFTYAKKSGQTAVMSYMSMPDAAYDDRDVLAKWARLAFEAAARAKAVKPAKTGRSVRAKAPKRAAAAPKELSMAVPSIDRVRSVMATLSDVQEGLSYGTPAWRFKKKLLARLWEDFETLVLRCPKEDIEVLMAAAPDLYFQTAHYAGYDAILVRVALVSDEELAHRVRLAVAHVAPARPKADPGGRPQKKRQSR